MSELIYLVPSTLLAASYHIDFGHSLALEFTMLTYYTVPILVSCVRRKSYVQLNRTKSLIHGQASTLGDLPSVPAPFEQISRPGNSQAVGHLQRVL